MGFDLYFGILFIFVFCLYSRRLPTPSATPGLCFVCNQVCDVYFRLVSSIGQALGFALYLVMYYFVFCLILYANEYVTYILGMYKT